MRQLRSRVVETRLLLLVRHAPTAATDARAFPDDEPVDERTLSRVRGAALPSFDRCAVSPSRRAIQTAEALGAPYEAEPRIAECDFGSWRGRTVAEIAQREADAFGRWLADSDAAPHNGESLSAVAKRVDDFMRDASRLGGTTLAVTHGGVIKVAVARALGAPLPSMWRVRCDPLSVTTLEYTHDSWELVSSNVPIA